MGENRRQTRGPGSLLRRRTLRRLDSYVGYWLRCVSKQVSDDLSRRMEEEGVALAEWIVMRELYDGDRRPAALAATLGLTRGAVSKLAAKLVANHMVTLHASPRDGRAQMLALSDLGRATVPVLAVVMDDVEDEVFGELEPRTRELIIYAMRGIVHRRRLRSADGLIPLRRP